MRDYAISIDPGLKGVMTIWDYKKDLKKYYPIEFHKWNSKDEYFSKDIYKQAFEKYNSVNCYMEYIATCMNGSFASYILGQNIGLIRGLAFGEVNIRDKGYVAPIQWKSGYEGLMKPRGVKWAKDEAKKRSIAMCEKLYPEIDLRTGEVIKHRDGTIEEIKDDNKSDSILIGHFALNIKKFEDEKEE